MWQSLHMPSRCVYLSSTLDLLNMDKDRSVLADRVAGATGLTRRVPTAMQDTPLKVPTFVPAGDQV